ncbi:MAG: hypothetical protein EXS16_05095, partial [Gemmataceae bacterium]|nr:hypothetical protein [Gemmataceae bacterium]
MLANRRREIVAAKAKENQKEHGGTAPGIKKNTSGKIALSVPVNTRAELAKPAQEECLPRFGKIARTGTGQHPCRTSPARTENLEVSLFETRTDLGCGIAKMEQFAKGFMEKESRFLSLQRRRHRTPRQHDSPTIMPYAAVLFA